MSEKRKQIFKIALWLVFYLVIIDISINILFKFPENPAVRPPTFLQGYFEYGRSVEGKLDRMVKNWTDNPSDALGYGWLINERYSKLPATVKDKKILVAVYGMSHTKELSRKIAEQDSRFVIRDVTAPGAPPNWSFAEYEIDKEKHSAQVVILGIMTDAVPYLGSTAGMTSYFEMSHPYTFPRYYVKDGVLERDFPPYCTPDTFREYFFDSKKWNEYRDWLSKNDKFYSPFLFNRSVADASAMLRFIRRSYAEKFKAVRVGQVYSKAGFNLDSEEIITLREILKTFARTARARKSIPIIYIVNNEGRSDHLYQALKPALESDSISYLSTHIICPPDDPRIFTGVNSHFIPSKDAELAKEMIRIVEKELDASSRTH